MMTPEEYCLHDATGLATLIRTKEVTEREVAATAASAIAALNPKLNAVIECFEDRISGSPTTPTNPDAPFAGLPWLLKDIGAGEPGRKQEQGSRLLDGHVTSEETYLSSRMREAGLINIGRTTVPEFAYDGNTESLLQGSTRNPWDTSLSAGGSSGGAGACVASGIVPAAHASDGAGSIRIPASYNGLVGLKPTRGRVSTWPIFIADRPLGHATEFVVCRSIRDAAGMLDAFSGPAPTEPRTLPAPHEPFSETFERAPANLKVAINWDNGGPSKAHPAAVKAVATAARVLEQAGCNVEEQYPNVEYRPFAKAMTDLWSVEIATMLTYLAVEAGRPLDSNTLEPNALGLLENSRSISGQDMMEALLAQDAAGKAFHDFLHDYDVLVTPTTCGPAPPLGTTGPFTKEPWVLDFTAPETGAVLQFTFQANTTGQPAISLPLGWTEDGLPIGVQFQARYGADALLLQIARLFEQAVPWSTRRPNTHFTNPREPTRDD